jgi:hypothetical protein
MSNQDILLNIAVNLGRLGRWADEEKIARIPQFLKDTQVYVDMLNSEKINKNFLPTFIGFSSMFKRLESEENYNDAWAEEAFTWANILTHRAKLA